jgi:octaprenyl-diphosphate synthase
MAAVEERLAGLVPESVGGLAPVVYRQMLAAGGKRLRPLMLLLSCAAAGGDSLRGVSLAVAAEVLHLASLIHDDVIDESEQRRGRPSARQQWGNKAAVLVGDLLVAEVFHRLAEDLEHKSVALLAHTVGEMCCAELAHATDPRNLDEAAYRCNIRGKTAALMGTVCEVGALAAGNEAAAPVLREFGRRLGEAFQITDDLLDLHGDAVTVGKPVQQDLRRGQWTLAVLHALGHGSPEEVCRLRDLLAQAPEDAKAARQAALLVGELGGRDYARQVAAGLASEAQAALQGLPFSPARGSLEELARYAVQREC